MDIIERAEHLLDGITAGEWVWDEWPDKSVISAMDTLVAVAPSVILREQSSLDARFIAAAPELVRDLIAEVQQLRGVAP
ncbi:Uncharacterised protein [Mycobacteroides abscessus subsp. abscessus]|uniref:hypothetical protein n=1 Tax=Mycobacteroides abscessus TaxID=36809 RepID=UPI0009A60747|nr:hypothetical protein [Mycobacteroides abscessus]SKQ87675.1 Uncharacterised protein [Mycobacteroides abscessus subsp. abscessus]